MFLDSFYIFTMFETHWWGVWGVPLTTKAVHVILVGFLSLVALVHFRILSIVVSINSLEFVLSRLLYKRSGRNSSLAIWNVCGELNR